MFCDIEPSSSSLTTPLLNLCEYHSGSCDHTQCCGSLSQQSVLSTVRAQISSPKLSSGQTIFCALRACIFSMCIYRPLSGIGISYGIFLPLLCDFKPELLQVHWTILACFRLILGLGSLNKCYTSETRSHNYGRH
jgi:hypothetical protein